MPTVVQLKALLKKNKIPFPSNARKATLEKLASQHHKPKPSHKTEEKEALKKANTSVNSALRYLDIMMDDLDTYKKIDKLDVRLSNLNYFLIAIKQSLDEAM